jgi:aryl-alcohol dehydrogenase-like predicted oxidoreductase
MVMNYRPLGSTGLRVSEISLGTVELGLDYGVPVGGEHLRPPEEQAIFLLNRALDLGVNFIDTASAYGVSEQVIGKALRTRRNEYVLATKLAHIPEELLTDSEVRAGVQASITASLQALQTDRIDLLLIHSAPVEVIRSGRILQAMLEAKQAGQVRAVGASTYGEEAALAVLKDGRYDALQVAYNLADRSMEASVLPVALEKKAGIVVRSVLLRGVLTHRYRHIPDGLAALRSAIEAFQRLAGEQGITLPEIAYRFVLEHPAVSTALVGTSRVEELEAALVYAQRGPLPPSLRASIRGIDMREPNQLNPSTWPADLGVWQGGTGNG